MLTYRRLEKPNPEYEISQSYQERDENDAINDGQCWRSKHNHLENLGFVTGGNVTVISTIGGNLIVNVKESRVAISREMANKIMI